MGVVLTAQHLAGRLAFAREHQDWQICHWRPVLFTDKSRFTLSTCDGRDRVWRCCGERSSACNILQHDRFGSGSVMVWGGISLKGALHVLARGSLTAIRYRDEILRPLVRPYAGAVGPGFLLMQDNARPHVAGVYQQFLQDEDTEAMDLPAHPPDLNPIEHIWDIMSCSIHQCHVAPQTVQELADALVQALYGISSLSKEKQLQIIQAWQEMTQAKGLRDPIHFKWDPPESRAQQWIKPQGRTIEFSCNSSTQPGGRPRQWKTFI
ncbi:hypothetical protein NFI96_004930 [Prochilodus magdalenae]|nr:hypothetical protein NFI96_004930 [Prochilodus magdalenae]